MELPKKSRTPAKSPRKPNRDPQRTLSDADSVFSVSSMESSVNNLTGQISRNYVSRSGRSTIFQTVQPSQSSAIPVKASSDTELISPTSSNPHAKILALVDSLDEGTIKIASESEAFSKAAANRRENSKASSLAPLSLKIHDSLNEISMALKDVTAFQSVVPP